MPPYRQQSTHTMTHTHKRTVYLVRRGWVTEDKRTGFGDGETLEETFAPTFREAETAFWAYVAKDLKTDDRGSYWARATVEVYPCDENDEFTRQPILEFRSPIPEAS